MQRSGGATRGPEEGGRPARRLPGRVVANLLLLLLSTVGSLLCAEVVVRLAGGGRVSALYLYPPGSEIPDIQTDWDLVYRINSSGLRGEDVPVERPPGVSGRVLVIGDSFTFGMGVELPDAFPARLEVLLRDGAPGARVVNVSAIGLDAEAYPVLLEELGLRYAPDVVVVNVYGNDASSNALPAGASSGLRDLMARSRLVTLARRVRRSVVARRAAALATDPRVFWGEIEARCRTVSTDESCAGRLAGFLEQNGDRLNTTAASCLTDPADVGRWVATDLEGPGWERFTEAMTKLVDLTRAAGVPLVIGIIPDGPQVSARQLAFRESLGVRYPPDVLTAPGKFQEAVRGLAARLGIPCLDPIEEFRASPTDAYFDADLHWNCDGHLLYAAILGRFLLDRGLVGDHRQASTQRGAEPTRRGAARP